jgi:hypothetical protein
MTRKRPKPESPIPDRPRRRPADDDHAKPAGVDGANVGYWQSVGASRSAAKRSKRP